MYEMVKASVSLVVYGFLLEGMACFVLGLECGNTG